MSLSSQQILIEKLSDKIAHLIADQSLQLPPAPNLLTEISAFSDESDQHLQNIVTLLSDHPQISQRILIMANSPSLGARVQIKTLPLAIARLGLSKLQVIASSAVISDYLQNLKLYDLLPYFQRVWQRSLHVAAISYVIASAHQPALSEKALLAGLIHNIGVMPLLKHIAELPELRGKASLMELLAETIIPAHYTEIGTALLSHWQISPELIHIPLTHQTPPEKSLSTITLSEIVFISYHLNQMVDYFAAEDTPAIFTQNSTFAKFWPDWPSATTDLINYTDKIKQIQSDIS